MEESQETQGIHLKEIWQGYRIPLFIGGASVFVISVSLILLIKSIQMTKPIEFFSNKDVLDDSSNASLSANQKKTIFVDIEGGVRAPGVYKLVIGSRVDDAIAKADGLSEEADRELLAQRINRASVLVDGAKIYIPKKGDASSTSYNFDQSTSQPLTSDNILISVNTSSQNQLEALPGIGPVTAKKIIDNRPYQTLEELVSKKALSKSLYEKLKDRLTL